MEQQRSWNASWSESKAGDAILQYLFLLLIPGFFLLMWNIADPSGGWAMSLPMFVSIFIFFPYAIILTVISLIRMFSGGTTHTASLVLVRGESDGAYRVDGKWLLEASCAGETREIDFMPQDLEGFLRETHSSDGGLAVWYRVVAWRKRQTPAILLEKVPGDIAQGALDWLHKETGTRSPVF